MSKIAIVLLIVLPLASACGADTPSSSAKPKTPEIMHIPDLGSVANPPPPPGASPASGPAQISDLSPIADQIDDGYGSEVEPALMALREKEPRNPEVFTQLARIEYLRAVDDQLLPDGSPPMNWDAPHLDAAEQWVRQALRVDDKHANAWVVYGQIEYVRSELDESLRKLERAEALDPSSVKLRLRKGATLRALAEYYGDKSLLPRSVSEYEQAIHGAIDDGNERLAANEVAEVFAAMGEYDKALGYLNRALKTARGRERAIILDRKSRTDLLAGRADAAIADARDAVKTYDHSIAQERLASALLVRAGKRLRDGNKAGAGSDAALAERTGADLVQLAQQLAVQRGTFPAVYAYLLPDLKQLGGAELVAAALVVASPFIAPSDLRGLKKLGADLNLVDPVSGTLLHQAIETNNVEAVATLLELGVDTTIGTPDGRTTLETTLIGTSPERRRIRQLVLAKVGKPPDWKEPDLDMPVEGHWYKAERSLGSPGGKVLQAGQKVLAGGRCSVPAKSDLCMSFYTRPGELFGTVTIPFNRRDDLKALRELPGLGNADPLQCVPGTCRPRAKNVTEMRGRGEGSTREVAVAQALESMKADCSSILGIPISDSFKVGSEEAAPTGHRVEAAMQCERL